MKIDYACQTFSNGETIETTSEHPFYVVGRGFVKAGELGIGTSIVTRAGPSAKVIGVQPDVRTASDESQIFCALGG